MHWAISDPDCKRLLGLTPSTCHTQHVRLVCRKRFADRDISVWDPRREAPDNGVHNGRSQTKDAQHDAHFRVAPAKRRLCEYGQAINVRLHPVTQ